MHLATTSINSARGQTAEPTWPDGVDTRTDTTIDVWPQPESP